jgi:hypothetical protein
MALRAERIEATVEAAARAVAEVSGAAHVYATPPRPASHTRSPAAPNETSSGGNGSGDDRGGHGSGGDAGGGNGAAARGGGSSGGRHHRSSSARRSGSKERTRPPEELSRRGVAGPMPELEPLRPRQEPRAVLASSTSPGNRPRTATPSSDLTSLREKLNSRGGARASAGDGGSGGSESGVPVAAAGTEAAAAKAGMVVVCRGKPTDSGELVD